MKKTRNRSVKKLLRVDDCLYLINDEHDRLPDGAS